MIFYQAMVGTRVPERADASALGTLPTRGYRYCEALRSASALGFYGFPPATLAFEMDRAGIHVWVDGDDAGILEPGDALQHPGARAMWNGVAPPHLHDALYPMLIRSQYQTNLVQVWTGWLAKTDPGWGTLVRPVANLPRPGGYDLYEGFIETDRWFGPLFANVALAGVGTRITLRGDWPLCQIQPLPRAVLTPPVQFVPLAGWSADDWQRYHDGVVVPSRDQHRLGAYAVRTRQRAVHDPPGQYDESCEGEMDHPHA